MRFEFLDRRSAERFAELLDEPAGAGRQFTTRGPADERLAELVTVGQGLSATKPGVRVNPEFRMGLRAMLVATAERDGIGRTDRSGLEADEGATIVDSGRRFALLGRGGRRIRARGAIVIGVAAGALAVSGISAASENATPGDALYGVKRSTEKAQLAMAGSDLTRGQLSLDFARTRLAEAASMTGGDRAFAGVLDDMDADTRKGVNLLTTSSVARKDVKPLSTVESFALGQRQTLSGAMERLSASNQRRAVESIGLLDDVRRRAEDLRSGLGCGTITSLGSDALGPELRGCVAKPDSSNSTQRPPGRSGKSTTKPGLESRPKSEKTGSPDGTTGPTDDPTDPATPGDVTPTVSPAASVDPTPAATSTGGGSTDDKTPKNNGPLGGLLGNLFGSN